LELLSEVKEFFMPIQARKQSQIPGKLGADKPIYPFLSSKEPLRMVRGQKLCAALAAERGK
jgi:hypothetical protein